jgi:hypothetical protein
MGEEYWRLRIAYSQALAEVAEPDIEPRLDGISWILPLIPVLSVQLYRLRTSVLAGFSEPVELLIYIDKENAVRLVRWLKVALVALVSLSIILPRGASAESPVKLKNWSGAIDLAADHPVPFVLDGKASHLGRFRAYGEVAFVPGEVEGTLIGDGVVVFEAANGDLLVGIVAWDVDAGGDEFRTSRIHLSWRDSVQFSDGTVVSNTGRFVKDRPPGLIVVAIIGVLIGLLLPAIHS